MAKGEWYFAGHDNNGNAVFRDSDGRYHWQGTGRGLWVHKSNDPRVPPVCKIKP